ncbi:universal stress protein [Micrococcus luteus]|uniref:universal stress protein n=1 Tax=Micrococcus luteus TaxID=1270 RepID=UPI0033DC2F58
MIGLFQNILLAADGSSHSIRSAEYTVGLAKKFSSKVEVVYVVDGETAKSDVLYGADHAQVEKNRQERMQPITDVLQAANIDYTVTVLHGDPGPKIVAYANKHDIDCVIVGSRGRNNFQTFLLGSVSHKVAKQVECPVLIVK